MDWPARGVYFFREPGESRTDTGSGPRIVRVGTHAAYTLAGVRLWYRLRQHKGQPGTDGGNHRSSIFRNMVGAALINRRRLDCLTWGKGKTVKKEVRIAEHALEYEVSQIIGNMPFLWLSIGDAPGSGSRGHIERNSIALLSNYNRPPLDPPSPGWLGHHCNQEKVRTSGLWNSNHVGEDYDPTFLDHFYRLVAATGNAP